MKIINRTHWQTKQLRAIVARVAKHEFENDRAKIKRLVITIGYNRSGKGHMYSTGHAAYHSNYSTVLVGKHGIDHIDFAHTVAHEFGHNRGLTHNDMRGNAWYTRMGRWREIYAWAADMPIEVTPKKKKPAGLAAQMLRYKRTVEGIGRWETKLKRATNALKKLRKTRTRYERIFAAKGVPTDGGE